MAKFRKKPIVVEAIRLEKTKESFDNTYDFLGDSTVLTIGENNNNDYIKINTLEGIMKAEVGDYIIKGVKGEFYPCKADIFKQTYEPVI